MLTSIKWDNYLAGSLLLLVMTVGGPHVSWSQQNDQPVYRNEQGELAYTKDDRGNRIPDFSYAGYMAGEQPIPDVPIRIVVPVKQGDDTRRIQAAINYVASLPVNEEGIRGAVLLEEGTYRVEGHLTFSASGVVLRGSGMNKDGTTLVGAGLTRETLIRIAGKDNRHIAPEVNITDPYVPVNSMQFQVEVGHQLQEGDKVQIRRPSTRKWIDELGMYEFGGKIDWIGWKPGERDILWDRTVTEVEDNTITIDAPITTALDSAYGGGSIAEYSWPGRIHQVGIENIRLVSTYDQKNPKDESHRWMAISMEHVQDAWVRQVVFEHFAGSAVLIRRTGRRITVQDSKSLTPVSEIGGQRRYTFWTKGQQTLFQRLYAENGYHDFAVGNLSTLNAFVQATSMHPHSFSGTINSWASGALFDIVNIEGEALRFANRGQDNRGAGWTAANSMIWQCSAAKITSTKPPTATNWAIGIWAQYTGDGYWGHVNDHVEPRSLYYAQLAARLGKGVKNRAHLLPVSTESYTSPTKEQAAQKTSEAMEPPPQLDDWIDEAPQRDLIPTTTSDVKRLDPADIPAVKKKTPPSKVKIVNGWLVHEGKVLTGARRNVRWWRGGYRPFATEEATPHVTRYVPGHSGYGLTDSLHHVVEEFEQTHVGWLDHNYGLWYDRRRDDHQRVRRMDGDVWAPFYEQPFARSGEGTAWDGLSKYDLTKYNPWYWDRLDQFADLAERKGIMLIHQNYFQHNILEAGAHWADFPWRTANNINDTGFPEPPNYAGDKRIFMSKQFYNVDDPNRRSLHKAYIRKSLSNFTDNSNVVQFIGKEYTGPLHFVEFWIDTIQEWEQETGNDPFIGLSVTKDVQDSILTDPGHASTVDLIDIRRWHYRGDGSLYAPQGGQFLAPRQHARLVETGSSNFEQVYRAVREYREQYPLKAVTYSTQGEEYGWAVFMAGGSMAELPRNLDTDLLAEAVDMHPVDLMDDSREIWALGNEDHEYIIYIESGDTVPIDLKGVKNDLKAIWIDPDTGKIMHQGISSDERAQQKVNIPESGPIVLWITEADIEL